jgi:hypothetical protein
VTSEEIARLDAGRKPEDQQILGCLRNEIGVAQARAADAQRAARSYAQAIDTAIRCRRI